MRVVNNPMSSTVPPVPPMSTASPRRNGRSMSTMMPAATLARVPCSARPIARPAAPSSATMLVVCTPKRLSTATSVNAKISHRTARESTTDTVVSTRPLRDSPALARRETHAATTQPTIRMRIAPTTFSPYWTHNSVRRDASKPSLFMRSPRAGMGVGVGTGVRDSERHVAVLAERPRLLLGRQHAQVTDERFARALRFDHVVDVAASGGDVRVVEARPVLGAARRAGGGLVLRGLALAAVADV